MELRFFVILAILSAIDGAAAGCRAAETISGLVLPLEGGGMTLRNLDGETKVRWTEQTQVALEIKADQLAPLATVLKPPAPAAQASVFKFPIPWSEQVIEFSIPDGQVGLQVDVHEVGKALELAEAEKRIEVGGLRLRFGLERVDEHLPNESQPSFSGRWIPGEGRGALAIDGHRYGLSPIGGGPDALLFNVLTTADCHPFVNRATVSGRRDGGEFIADEIHLTPIGDQASLDEPELPRYLFIGDSISGNYSQGLRSCLAGKFNIHHPPTNCGPSGFGKGNIVEWLGAYGERGRHWDVISFNFGHWDAGNSKADYQANLEVIIAELERTGAQLVWVTTCPVPGGARPVGELTADGKAPGQSCGVMRRFLNPWAAEVIARHPHISTCDLWSFVDEHKDDLYSDWWPGTDVHFGGEQAAALGEVLGQHILEVTGR